MGYTVPPTLNTGDFIHASDWNLYVKDNFEAGIPGAMTAKGDILVSDGSKSAEIISVGSNDESFSLVGGTADWGKCPFPMNIYTANSIYLTRDGAPYKEYISGPGWDYGNYLIPGSLSSVGFTTVQEEFTPGSYGIRQTMLAVQGRGTYSLRVRALDYDVYGADQYASAISGNSRNAYGFSLTLFSDYASGVDFYITMTGSTGRHYYDVKIIQIGLY